jgi:hypothetical protein
MDELDPLFSRSPEMPLPIEGGDTDNLDAAGASQLTASLTQNISARPNMALAAHANQLSGNVLSLLQPAD